GDGLPTGGATSLEKEETQGKGSAGLFLEEKTGCLSCNGRTWPCVGRRSREGETKGKTCERGAKACVEENGVGSSCGEGKEKW
ncbi:hypothetical protein H0E87_020193, partial [Populus deltoides]